MRCPMCWLALRHPLQIVFSFPVEPARVVFEQYPGEPVYAPQGCPQVVGNGVAEGFELFVGAFELPVGVFQTFAYALGPGAAAHEHPGNEEEQETCRDTAGEHEIRKLALVTPFERRKRGEVQAPLTPRDFQLRFFGEEWIVLLIARPAHPVVVVEERARGYVFAVVDFEIYAGVECSSDDVLEQASHPEAAADETLHGSPPLSHGPNGHPPRVYR